MRIKIDKCYKCLCVACSRFKCPYINRCNVCSHNNFKYVFDCDFFESKRIAPKRYKFKRYQGNRTDRLNDKLDYIIANMGLVGLQCDKHGTYDVIYKGQALTRVFSYREALEYVERYQGEFKELLKIQKVGIDI